MYYYCVHKPLFKVYLCCKLFRYFLSLIISMAFKEESIILFFSRKEKEFEEERERRQREQFETKFKV